MIQRIQTIWLILASLALFAMFIFPTLQLSSVDGSARQIYVTGVQDSIGANKVQTEGFTLLTIGAVIVALFPLLVIWFYRDRKKQTLLCYLTIVIIISFGFWLSQTAKAVAGSVTPGIGNFGIGAMLPSLSIIFILLAARGIRNDEKLVRSSERLR
jgi:Na+/melibiose symporter-like transporter